MVFGYGICTSDLVEDITLDRLEKLIECAPIFKKDVDVFTERLGSVEVYDILDTFVEVGTDAGCGGLAAILAEVISEAEDIRMDVVEADGEEYVVFPPSFPWEKDNLTEKERTMTEEKMTEILDKYLGIVTDEVLEVGYKKIE